MKLYTFLLMLFFFACSSHNQSQFDNSTCDFDDTILESDKILNIDTYSKKQLDSKGSVVIKENNELEINLSSGYGDYDKRYKNKLTHIIKLINYDNKTLKATNSYCFFSKGNFNIGNEYAYNDQGEIIKTINHNQYHKYPICYKEIIKTVLEKVGKKYELHNLQRDSIKIENGKYQYAWEAIVHRKDDKEDVGNNGFRIDAKTGKIIKQWISVSTPD